MKKTVKLFSLGGVVLFLLGEGFASANEISDYLWGSSRLEKAHRVLRQIQEEPQIREVLRKSESNTLNVTQNILGPTQVQTTRFQHYYHGLEVIGSQAFHPEGINGVSIRNKIAQFDLDINPTLPPETAVVLAQGITGGLSVKQAPSLQILPSSKTPDSAQLIYKVEMEGTGWNGGKDILINAHNGRTIAVLAHEIPIAPTRVYSARNQGVKVIPDVVEANSDKVELKGCLIEDLGKKTRHKLSKNACLKLLNGDSALGKTACQIIMGDSGFPVSIHYESCLTAQLDSNGAPLEGLSRDTARDDSVIRAAKNSDQVLDYYHSHFNRESYDNQGSTLTSVVHAGEEMDNAFWNKVLKIMVYGDGNGRTTRDFTTSIDVAGHEMTHGVTEETAKLLMMGESGSLNEAFSDLFGKLIENKGEWVVGKGLFLDTSEKSGIRNLADPHRLVDEITDSNGNTVKKPYPAKFDEAVKTSSSETCDESNDSCWVHYNSTIPSHASYLVYQAIGSKKTELLYYTALTQNISSTDDFSSAAKAILSTCEQINLTHEECDTVKKIYQTVGVL